MIGVVNMARLKMIGIINENEILVSVVTTLV